MKHRSTIRTVIPKGWDGRDFNKWQSYLQKQVARLNGTNKRLAPQEP